RTEGSTGGWVEGIVNRKRGGLLAAQTDELVSRQGADYAPDGPQHHRRLLHIDGVVSCLSVRPAATNDLVVSAHMHAAHAPGTARHKTGTSRGGGGGGVLGIEGKHPALQEEGLARRQVLAQLLLLVV